MNELAEVVVFRVLITTVYLSAGTFVVAIVLRWSGVTSPSLSRLAWGTPILLGWMFVTVPIEVPWRFESSGAPVVVLQASSSDQGPLADDLHGGVPAESAGRQSFIGLRTASPIVADALRWDNWPAVLALCWLLGMIVVAVRAGLSYVRFVRGVLREESRNASWRQQWQSLQRSAGVNDLIPLVAAEDCGPALCRLPRGYVLLVPESLWRTLTAGQRQAILMHELAHYQRADVWKSLTLRILALPHWFNPCAWYAVRRFDECSEMACDEAAVRGGADHVTDYAKALVALGHVADATRAYSPAARGHGLVIRVKRLLAGNLREDSVMKKSVVLVAMAALIVGSVVRFDLVAEEVPGDTADGEAQQGEGATTDAADDDVPERLDRTRVLVGESFFVAAVTTPLQRVILRKHNDHEAVAYANINAKSFIVPGTGLIDLQQSHVSELRRALRQISDNHSNAHLRIVVNFGYRPPDDASRNVDAFLMEAFEGMGGKAGFTDVWAYGSWWNVENYVWRPIEVHPQQDDAAEENVGTDLVQVYPVRTSLSHYLTRGANCYIRMDSPPLQEWKAEYLETLSTAVRQLDLEDRRIGRVQVFIPGADDDLEDGLPPLGDDLLPVRRDPQRQGLEVPADDVAKVLLDVGFQEVVIGIQKGATNRTQTYR